MSGLIYFAQAGADGPIKIGFCGADIHGRIASIQVGCPHQVKLLGVVCGDRHTEAEFHRRFAHLSLRGEWFAPDSGLLSEIAAVTLAVPSVGWRATPCTTHPLEIWRAEHGMKAVDLASLLGCTEAHFSMVIRRKRGLSYALAKRISEKCNIPIDILMAPPLRVAAEAAE